MRDIGLEIFYLDDKQRRLESQLALISDQATRRTILNEIANLKDEKRRLSDEL